MNFSTKTPPMIGFAAWSGTGKTTLLAAVIPLLRARGLRVAVVKHAHHEFDIDVPGKDSYKLREAGADMVLVGSRKRIALMLEREQTGDPKLADLLALLPKHEIDLILVEGMKQEKIPKIELHRPALNKPLLCAQDEHIIAIATDAPVHLPRLLPVLDLNHPASIAEFIIGKLGLQPSANTLHTR